MADQPEPGAEGDAASIDPETREETPGEAAPEESAATSAGQAPEGEDEASPAADDVPDWERRRRLAEVFGDVLPATTRDERGGGNSGHGEDWYRRETPPHHGS